MNELLLGLQSVLHWGVLASLGAGAALGIVIGVLPGIGPGVAIAVMLPMTYGMSPMAGLVLLLGIYCGAFYGGAVTSILIRTPGTNSAAATHPKGKKNLQLLDEMIRIVAADGFEPKLTIE